MAIRKIARRIELDMGHRVARHESKCSNLHGHRYVIECTILSSDLVSEGSEKGMVLDFGNLKNSMQKAVHDVFDHSLTLEASDPLLITLLGDHGILSEETLTILHLAGYLIFPAELTPAGVKKLVLTAETPTAENLAELWIKMILKQVFNNPSICQEAKNNITSAKIRVYETPNCWADHHVDYVQVDDIRNAKLKSH